MSLANDEDKLYIIHAPANNNAIHSLFLFKLDIADPVTRPNIFRHASGIRFYIQQRSLLLLLSLFIIPQNEPIMYNRPFNLTLYLRVHEYEYYKQQSKTPVINNNMPARNQ